MLRIVVSEHGQPALPPIDSDAPVIVIGSAATAQVRLPASAAREAHVRIERDRWLALADVIADGSPRTSGSLGANGVTFDIGGYRIHVGPAPANTKPTLPQRTESLARELLRNLLGAVAAPTLVIERGPGAGARRALAPPESTLVIGRGDEAGWSIVDEDISRTHLEIRRTWDGIVAIDLESETGTRVDGVRIARETPLRDGARLELGSIALVFSDPTERHLPTSTAPPPTIPARRPSLAAFLAATLVAGSAIVALVYVLAS